MTKRRVVRVVLASAAIVFAGTQAIAQGEPYNLPTMNFDLWCQETAHLPAERCDKRLPKDDAAFEAYRAKVEKFELRYHQGREKSQYLDRAILHNDPIDNPVTKNPEGASQAPPPATARPSP